MKNQLSNKDKEITEFSKILKDNSKKAEEKEVDSNKKLEKTEKELKVTTDLIEKMK